MPNLTSDALTYDQQLFSSSSTQRAPLGSKAVTKDGRVFRYCKAGASNLVVGHLIQAPAQIANHQQLTPSAAALGARQIIATLGATAAAENLYAEGWAIIDTTPGLGYQYPISGHLAVASAGVITLELPADSLIQVALTAVSRVSLQQNPYHSVIQSPTTATGAVVGVAVYPITASHYGWIQTHGPGAVLIDGAPAVGTPVRASDGTAGAVEALVVTTATAIPASIVGNMLVTGVTGKVQAVMLTIN